MANPALLLVKPLLKAIGKQAVKLIGKEAAKAGVSAGLTAASKGGLTALDAVNIARAAVDKKIAPTIAKSLGMTTKELQAITNGIKMTEARKKAVTGKNFLKNVNRFVENPQTSIKQYIKNEVKRKATKGVQDTLKKGKEGKENAEQNVKRSALTLLDGKLQKIDNRLKLSKRVWDNIDNIEIDNIFSVLEKLEVDMYYRVKGRDEEEVIFTDEDHKGYKGAMSREEYMGTIEDELLGEFRPISINGII